HESSSFSAWLISHAPAVPLDDAFDESQSETDSLLARGHQRFEQARAHRRVDTRSVVGDPDDDLGRGGLRDARDGCNGPGCRLRVLEEVDEDLAELGRVAADCGKMG